MKKHHSKSEKKHKSLDLDHIPAFQKHPDHEERYAEGKNLRDKCPRSSHAIWKAQKKRENTIHLIKKSEKNRMSELLPLRHGRMMQSPFTFYRAGAQIMAADLASTPNTGIRVQSCGDAHISNFGGFATPERQIIFSINDLDETLPAPWEWDIKRLAASFVIACRNNNLSDATAREVTRTCVQSYRERMAKFSEMKQLALWYYLIESTTLISDIKDAEIRKRALNRIEKARESRIAEDVFPKLAGKKGENIFIKDNLPTIFHWEGHSPGEIENRIKAAFADYRETLTPAHRLLLDRYELKDAAIKVVGVGSVGTRCWVLLFMAENKDPLFLQVKESGPSVLEPYAGKSKYANHGQRVVNGYRIMQPASDIFLGWTRGEGGRDFYFRQLRDMKIKMEVENFGKTEMLIDADWCGHALALSHARSGDSAMISGYMGQSDKFDKALEDFAIAYADQNEKDYDVFTKAVKKGKLKAVYEEEK
jgi:uncharacterized protein (DUF2252 family)